MKRSQFFLSVLYFLLFAQVCNSTLKVGDYSPTLSGFLAIDRQPDLTNKFVVIDFWATWCGPCIKALPHLNRLAEKYQGKVVFLAISDEKESIVRDFLQQVKSLDSKVFGQLFFGLDTRSEINIGFGIRYIPTYFLISPDKKILSTGISSDLNEQFLDSIINNSGSVTKGQVDLIRPDSVEKVSSIQITCQPGFSRDLRVKENSLLIRDTLSHILPYLYGVQLANRVRWEGTPMDMIEVNIYSAKSPVSSLKATAHDMILNSYGIRMKFVEEERVVWTMKVKDKSKLQDSTTVIYEGVKKRNWMLNDSVYQCDNFTLVELGKWIEKVNFPTIIYVNEPSDIRYDWNMKMFKKDSKQQVDFDRFREIMLKDFGVEFVKSVKKERITVYYLES